MFGSTIMTEESGWFTSQLKTLALLLETKSYIESRMIYWVEIKISCVQTPRLTIICSLKL